MKNNALQRRARLVSGVAPQAAVAAGQSPLDIAEIRHFPVQEPVSGNRYSLLRVKTRSGVVGWGESAYAPDAGLKALQAKWVGKPANGYATIAVGTPFRAALDIALLDILGKTAKAPICRILGGPTRAKVRGFSAPSTKEFPIAVVDLPQPTSPNQGKAYQNRVLELVSAIPAESDFVLAGHGVLTPGDAASVATTVESKMPLWFDEPCSVTNLEAVKKVAEESVVPLGFGRGIEDAGVFQSLLREGLAGVLRPELAFYGISGIRRIAALAESYYVAIAPRHSGGPIGTAAAIQLAASIPNFFIQNLPIPADPRDQAMRRELVQQPVETPKDGFLQLTNEPGLGITVNEAALEKYHAA